MNLAETEIDLARLRWRCRRGLLELDLIFQKVVERDYPGFSQHERQVFVRLLDEADTDLLEYVHGRQEPADPELREFIKKKL